MAKWEVDMSWTKFGGAGPLQRPQRPRLRRGHAQVLVLIATRGNSMFKKALLPIVSMLCGHCARRARPWRPCQPPKPRSSAPSSRRWAARRPATPTAPFPRGMADSLPPRRPASRTSSPGQHHPDPYASDKPLYTVTAANMGQYANKLTEGHKKLLQTYRDTLQDDRVSHASQRRLAAAHLRRHQAHRDHRASSPRAATAWSRPVRAFRSRFRRQASRCSGTTCCVIAATSSCATSARRR